MMIYENKIENRMTFKINAGYLVLLSPKIRKLFPSTKSKITKDKNGDLPHLEITEVILIHYNVFNSGSRVSFV